MSPAEAMAAIGLVFGDDGYMRNRPGLSEALAAVCKDLGLKLKPEVHTEGPYPYLGRFFCDPATTATSFQDPMRTLAKIHLSANKQVSQSQARVNKCLGYLTTDALTPLIGEYCRLSCKATAGDDPKTDYGGAKLTGEETYKLTLAWPQDPNDKTLIAEQVAKLCGIEALELEHMVKILENCASYLEVPLLFDNERKTKITAEVDGEVEQPEGNHTTNTSNESEPEKPGTSNGEPKATRGERVAKTGGRPRAKIGKPEPLAKSGRDARNSARPGGHRGESGSAQRRSPGRDPGRGPAQPAFNADRNVSPTDDGAGNSRGRATAATGRTFERSQKPSPMTVQKHGLGSGRIA